MDHIFFSKSYFEFRSAAGMQKILMMSFTSGCCLTLG